MKADQLDLHSFEDTFLNNGEQRLAETLNLVTFMSVLKCSSHVRFVEVAVGVKCAPTYNRFAHDTCVCNSAAG